MTPESFFENFACLADTPNGVQKLREVILQLAVRGKLVPQDSTEEPASKLLERMRAEKARLVKEKKIRKVDPAPPVTAKEAPYELPHGWNWVRLRNIGEVCGGGTPSKNNPEFWKGNIPWVSPKDMKVDKIEKSELTISVKALENSSVRLIPVGSLLVVARSGILKRTLPVCINQMECTVNQDIKVLIPYLFEINTYLQVLLKGFEGIILEKLVKGGMTVQSLMYSEFFEFPFPLPPQAEQQRIVAKVDQLMALCNELEARQRKKQLKLLRLNKAVLDRLTSVRKADEFTAAWQLVRDNFDILYTVPETIAKLRQCILQLSVEGKLIAPDNQGRWKEGVLGDVVERSEAGWSPQCENRPRIGDEWGMLKVSAVSWDRFKPDENKALPSHLSARPQYEVKIGDFLISRANTEELVAKSVVVTDTPPRLSLSDKTVRLHFRADASPRFFCLVNNSPASRQYYAGVAGGTSSSMKNVTRQQILHLPVLIPPFAEQLKVVAKVDRLMAICDELEVRLAKAKVKAEKMTVSAVQGLVAA